MSFIFRLSLKRDRRQAMVGVNLTGPPWRLAAVLLRFQGRGLDVRPDTVASETAELPAAVHRQLDTARASGAIAGDELLELGGELANQVAGLVTDLFAAVGVAGDVPLAIGLSDPGVWQFEDDRAMATAPLIDPVRVAEQTGLCVVDAFSTRDVVQRGQGGPLLPLPLWLLLRHSFRTRLLVEVGPNVHVTYLPNGSDRKSSSALMAFDAAPGTVLWESLEVAAELPAETRICQQLQNELLHAEFIGQRPPKWQPLPTCDAWQPIVDAALRRSTPRADVLRAAVDFAAEAVQLARARFLPPEPTLDEVILAGAGRYDPWLRDSLRQRFGDIPLLTAAAVGLQDEAIRPAGTALLASLCLDQIPANLPLVTGVEVPRVLGRLTPGSARNWNRVLDYIQGKKRSVMSLRSAS